MKKTIRFFLFVLVVLQTACGPDFLYKSEKTISHGVWSYRDTLDFRFTISDTTRLYDLYLDFEHADTFPTQNLYLKLYTLFPDGTRLSKVKSVDFFDSKGNPFGRSSGHTCRLHSLLQENTFFSSPGEYRITLEQYMRRDSLSGINAVGISVQQSSAARRQ